MITQPAETLTSRADGCTDGCRSRRAFRFPIVLTILASLGASIPSTAAIAAPAESPLPAPIILPDRKPPSPPPRSRTTKQAPVAKNAPAEAAAAIPPATTAPAAPSPSSTLSQRDREIFAQAIRAATRHEWAKARAAVGASRHPVLRKIIEWAYLREPGPHAGFVARTTFLAENPKWPSANEMRRRAEEEIAPGVPTEVISAWFAASPPLTTSGKVAYARALRAEGHVEQMQSLAREAWTTGTFKLEDERAFLRDFADFLTPDDHWARVDRILYDEQTKAAERLLPRLTAARGLVARARIALIGSAKNAESAVAAVPATLQNDPGLLYDRVKWRRQRGNEAGARQLVPPYSVSGPRPDLWWRERHALARDALAEGNVTEAYALAKHHGTTDPLSISEAEWLAGWIALRFLKDGEAALAHFQKVYDSVQTPPSLARGAYWTGRAVAFLGRPDLADEWYRRAGAFGTTYYGQLAIGRIRGDNPPQLPRDPAPTPDERAAFNAKDLTVALRALLDVDAKAYQRAFAQALAEGSDSATDRQLTAELLNAYARVDLGVVVARQAARDKITLLQFGYPAPAYSYPRAPEKALILAITRQESNFDIGALSSAGARGLMQLMPATAKAVAKSAKLTYAEKRLSSDAAYNMRLGSTYLEALISSFDGSYILAAAGYNAGPNRSRQWIKQFGDPRDPGVDVVDWVEQIPFSETRGYVQRVMENLMVYRAILDGNHQIQKNLEAELARRQ